MITLSIYFERPRSVRSPRDRWMVALSHHQHHHHRHRQKTIINLRHNNPYTTSPLSVWIDQALPHNLLDTYSTVAGDCIGHVLGRGTLLLSEQCTRIKGSWLAGLL